MSIVKLRLKPSVELRAPVQADLRIEMRMEGRTMEEIITFMARMNSLENGRTYALSGDDHAVISYRTVI